MLRFILTFFRTYRVSIKLYNFRKVFDTNLGKNLKTGKSSKSKYKVSKKAEL